MSEWKEGTLAAVVAFGNGKSRPKTEGVYPVYGGNGILGYASEFNYDGETVVIGRVGAYCGATYYEDRRIWVSDNALAAKAQQGSDTKYLYYLLKHLNLNQHAEGSSHPLVTQRLLNAIDVTYSDDECEQKAIASVLSSLDEKIDLLHRQNLTLEAMAETLFCQWFVEEAQEDWEEVKLGDLFDISSGKGLKRDQFNDAGLIPVLGANGEIGRTSDYLFQEKLIFTGRVGTLGNVFIVNGDKVWLSDNTLVFRKIRWFYFVYFTLKSSRLEDFNVGSTQPLVRQSDIKEIPVNIPNNRKLSSFEDSVGHLFAKMEDNKNQIRTLEKLRDTLLPKLMNGEVRLEI